MDRGVLVDVATQAENNAQTITSRLRLFFTFIDTRFEDLDKKTWKTTLYRDFSAGLVVALTAIPMAMGFAMAMGLRPEQGIIAGALACIVGRTFGGSKYQVYGPTAAFIPVVAGLMNKYGVASGGTFESAHGFLVLASILAGIVLMICGLLGVGKYAKIVPPSIVVGFTIGIAVSIALSNGSEALGLASTNGGLVKKVAAMVSNIGSTNLWALLLAAITFFMARLLLKVSIFIPAPLLALGTCTLLAATVLSSQGIALVGDRYGSIPNNFFVFTGPSLPGTSFAVFADLAYFVIAIVFVSGVESLLCSSMADRLANNKKTPFNPDKEFWGQGLVQVIVPLVNGFPCTGALARTATSIKAGALTPFAGYFKGILKLCLAFFMAPYLERVPMACIAGILLWVASNMIKKVEIKEVMAQGRFHTAVMIFTAIMVPVTDFLTGVISALVVHFTLHRFFDKPKAEEQKPELVAPMGMDPVGADAE